MTTQPVEPSSSRALLIRIQTGAPVAGQPSSSRALLDRIENGRPPTPAEVHAAARCEPLRPAAAR